MSIVGNIPLRDLDANPFRRVDVYPYVETKIAALMRSIADVGLWEGIIGREVDNRVQIAFGHHRVEAARRSDLHTIPVIIRDLDDEQMLKFMGRENGEDYNADFLCMLETWDAAKIYSGQGRKEVKDIDIARLLGWTDPSSKGADQMNNTSRACSGANQLLADGIVTRSEFDDMSVKAVREIVEKGTAKVKRIKNIAKAGHVEKKVTDELEKAAKKGTKEALNAVRTGKKTVQDAKASIDQRVNKSPSVKDNPMIDLILDGVTTRINQMMNDDATADKLRQVVAALKIPDIELNSAVVASLKDTRDALERLSSRTDKYVPALTPPATEAKQVGNVVPLLVEDASNG